MPMMSTGIVSRWAGPAFHSAHFAFIHASFSLDAIVAIWRFTSSKTAW
jgi:hypothetical protein